MHYSLATDRGMGISFQDHHHLLRNRGTAPKPHNLLAVAPQSIIAMQPMSIVPARQNDGGQVLMKF